MLTRLYKWLTCYFKDLRYDGTVICHFVMRLLCVNIKILRHFLIIMGHFIIFKLRNFVIDTFCVRLLLLTYVELTTHNECPFFRRDCHIFSIFSCMFHKITSKTFDTRSKPTNCLCIRKNYKPMDKLYSLEYF